MILESLESKKFDAFKENEIQNAFKIVGGKELCTGNGKDCYKDDTKGPHTGGDGTAYDYYPNCP